MRAIAASVMTKDPQGHAILSPLDAKIIRCRDIPRNCTIYGVHIPAHSNTGIGFTSLHKAKNAIRRHFGIEARGLMRWTEEVR